MTSEDVPEALAAWLPEYVSPDWMTPDDIAGLYTLFVDLFDFAREFHAGDGDFLKRFFGMIEQFLVTGDEQIDDATVIDLVHPMTITSYGLQSWVQYMGPLARDEYERCVAWKRKNMRSVKPVPSTPARGDEK